MGINNGFNLKNMKEFILYVIKLFTLLSLHLIFLQCSKWDPEPNERAALYILLLQNPGDKNIQSIVEMNLRDINSYEGKCLDSFFGITAGAYLNVFYPPESRDTEFRKVRGSTMTCSRMGFSGGAENRIDGRQVSFRSYFCGPLSSLCPSRAIQEAGF